jgi:pimeloyl-ACP methyl ester carboxylesterase
VVLLGGVYGGDGWVTSRGMLSLAAGLGKLPGTSAKSYAWDHWQLARDDLVKQHYGKRVVIGYSGGGMAAMWMANRMGTSENLDLVVLYDPSPPGQIESVDANTKANNIICYHNTAPHMWFPFIGQLGGGKPHVTDTFKGRFYSTDVAEFHLLVQSDASLHAKTMTAAAALNAGKNPIDAIERLT